MLARDAVCEPRVLIHGVFADEAAYVAKYLPWRFDADKGALLTLQQASFLFERLVAHPLVMLGLEHVTGHDFFDLFGNTIEKVGKRGFVEFDLSRRVDDNQKTRLAKLLEFSNKLEEFEKARHAQLEMPYDVFAGSVRDAILYSRAASLPFVAVEGPMIAPTIRGQAPLMSTRELALVGEVLSIELPHFGLRTLDEILDMRDMKGAREFRELMRSMVSDVCLRPPDYREDASAMKQLWNERRRQASDLLVQEFRKEILGWGKIKLGFSLALNALGIIPMLSLFTTAVSSVAEIASAADAKARTVRLSQAKSLVFLSDLRSLDTVE